MQMSQAKERLQDVSEVPLTDASELPVVIVGNGPAGIRAATEVMKRSPEQPLIIYGDEPWQPYNRVQLSSLLTGDVELDDLVMTLPIDEQGMLQERYGYEVTDIDPVKQVVRDSSGQEQTYKQLILALGSRPHEPPIEGYHRKGVYTFRNLTDAEHLAARRTRSRWTVVVGGGLLGLEAARGMQKSNTEVIVIDHSDRLLSRQLDEAGGEKLREFVESTGIQVILNTAVKRIDGDPNVTGIELFSGETIECDTIIVATGIVPNIGLAKAAGIKTARGIIVDDGMQTSAHNVFAIGECCEHRGQVYGLVAPGLEQASVAAHNLSGGDSEYTGSIAATRLKVLGENVFSVGQMADHVPSPVVKTPSFEEGSSYRRILVKHFRLEGALAIGEWPEQNRMLNAVAKRQWVTPWQLWRFKRTGLLWGEGEAESVVNWPASATVCQCTGVTRGEIGTAIQFGASCVGDVTKCTGASGVCGSCKPLVQELLGADVPAEPTRWSKALSWAALISTIAALLIFLLPAIPYNDSVQAPIRWDELWRDGLWKQVSGFTILGLFVLGLIVSPRKRVRKLQSLGSFDVWRLVHILTGVLVIAALLAHTGMRLGNGLNFYLMFGFTGLLLAGGLLTLSIAQEHRLSLSTARRLRSISLWMHLLLFWPVPVLLGFHIFKTYFF